MEKTKRFLEKHSDDKQKVASAIDGLPLRFYEHFVMNGFRVDLIEPGRIVCSFKVPARLLEEIEIESNVLRMGKTIAVVNVELRKKSNGKIIAQGRHTKYLAISSKL